MAITEPIDVRPLESGDREDAYFSIDVETDGPIPGRYSMLSFGIVAAGRHDGRRYLPPVEGLKNAPSFYVELQPVGEEYEQEALRMNGLDRDALRLTGNTPADAMRSASAWIGEQARGRRPVMVASPASFDWMFMHWYFTTYVGSSPFGHSSCFDIKTAVAVKFDRPVARSGRTQLPRWIESTLAHTHNAVEDAREQAEIFANLQSWAGVRERSAF